MESRFAEVERVPNGSNGTKRGLHQLMSSDLQFMPGLHMNTAGTQFTCIIGKSSDGTALKKDCAEGGEEL